jgi:hypothetical protein
LNGLRTAIAERPDEVRALLESLYPADEPDVEEGDERDDADGEQDGLSDFERFFRSHPRKGDRGQAEQAWNETVVAERVGREIFFTGHDHYLHCADVAKGFIKGAAKWLRDRGWEERLPLDPAWVAEEKQRRDAEERAAAILRKRQEAVLEQEVALANEDWINSPQRQQLLLLRTGLAQMPGRRGGPFGMPLTPSRDEESVRQLQALNDLQKSA